ncbi:MAG: YraN family protein [Hyphomicrobiaceae bacterium]|nr:YraN family protein [Hyphomicrobiaceae bacterium]
MTRLDRREHQASSTRRRRERRGRLSELLAAALLCLKGYRILARRYRSRAGEIDLIAVRGRRIAFVEVKRRPTLEAAEAAKTRGQAQRMARAAEQWLWRHPAYRDHEIGLDALLVVPRHMPRHQPDALQRAHAF